MTPEDRLVHCLPIFHAHGLVVGAYGTMTAGGSAVLLPGFDPGRRWPTPRATTGPSLFFGVPTMYHRLVASGRAGDLARASACACPAPRRCPPACTRRPPPPSAAWSSSATA